MALPPGTRLGPYETISLLGAGGMGEVYRAKDTRLDRTVAIKVLPAHLSSDPELKQRMEREARAISALQHPNICTLHDIGAQGGTDFLVMEYLEGQTLADRLEKGALPLDQVLKVGAEVAQALNKAHRQGIIHRDLKPANIMLTKADAKLMDFGLAKPQLSISSQATGPFTPSTPTMNLASPHSGDLAAHAERIDRRDVVGAVDEHVNALACRRAGHVNDGDLLQDQIRGLGSRERGREQECQSENARHELTTAFHHVLHLPKVIQVMSGVHSHEVSDRFFAPLLMHAVVLPKFLRQRFEHGQVAGTQYLKEFQGLFGIAVRIVESFRPGILVVCLDRGAIVAQDMAKPPSNHDFGIRHVGQNFADRPFAGRRLSRELFPA